MGLASRVVVAAFLGLVASGVVPVVLASLGPAYTGLALLFAALMLAAAVGHILGRPWARPLVLGVAVVGALGVIASLRTRPFGGEWTIPLLYVAAFASIAFHVGRHPVRA